MAKGIDRRSLITVVAGALVAASLPRRAFAMPTVDEITDDPALPVLGNASGSATIAFFVDYQCPYCKICYGQIMKLLAEDADVRVVVKDWPIFGGVSVYAARAVVASASHQNHPLVVDALMNEKRRLSKRSVRRIVAEAGVESGDLDGRIAAGQPGIDDLLNRNISHAHELGLKGTPGLLVGPVLYRHGLGVDKLRQALAFARTGEGEYPT